MARGKDNDIKYNSWDELLIALEKTYTISIKDVCKILKASRAWVNRYIRHAVPSVYIRTGYRGDSCNGVNWLAHASVALNKKMTESIWFDEAAFYKLLNNSIVSVTKQTKLVPLVQLMKPNDAKEYLIEIEKLDESLKSVVSISEREELLEKRFSCYEKYLMKTSEVETLMKHRKSITKRTEAMPVNVHIPDDAMNHWVAPHDEKEYGDVDETIYRRFFREGYIRIEIQLVDQNGCIGKKVFYLNDPNPLSGKGDAFTFSEEAWQEYIKSI